MEDLHSSWKSPIADLINLLPVAAGLASNCSDREVGWSGEMQTDPSVVVSTSGLSVRTPLGWSFQLILSCIYLNLASPSTSTTLGMPSGVRMMSLDIAHIHTLLARGVN